MFWGLSMEPGKRYTQQVENSFHISQATLDVFSKEKPTGPVQVILEFDGADYILATLSKDASIYQVPLDLNFALGEKISFRTIGQGRVHLCGYHVPEDDMDAIMNDEETDSEIEEETTMEESPPKPAGKRKKEDLPTANAKKSKMDVPAVSDGDEEEIYAEGESDDDDDDEENETFGSLGESTLMELEAEEGDSDDSDLEDEEEDDEDEDFNEDDDDDFDLEGDDDGGDSEEEKKVKPTVNGDVSGKKKKLLDKTATPKLQNGKVGQQKTPQTTKDSSDIKKEQKTPKQDKSFKQEQKTAKTEHKTPKQEQKTPKKEQKTPKQEAKSPQSPATGHKKVLEGGVIVEDLSLGGGPPAKSGRLVQVHYVGRLKSNNKQFDSTTQGPGFKFRLGRGEVIKGWDVGIAGMKVGGKRRITIPPAFAYGAKGSPPVIPPNAALVFEVDLKGVS